MFTKYQESEEMYLETLLLLKQKSNNVHAVNIAEELGYAKSSVSRGVNLLVQKGYITIGSGGELNFTESGKAKAEDIYERHIIITDLLVNAGVNREVAEENACRIEHVITPELMDALKKNIRK